MNALQSILVPIDGSSFSMQALPYARALAGQDSSVVLLQVIPEDEESSAVFMESEFGWAEGEELVTASHARECLQQLATQWASSGTLPMCPEVLVKIGEPAETILDVAQMHQSNLIVMTTHGYGALKRIMFGSVADRVVRHSLVPVLVVRPQGDTDLGAAAAIQRIVVPLDGSERAENALSTAKTLAQQLHVPMLLVRALHIDYVVPGFEGAFAVTQESMDDMSQLADAYLSTIREPLVAEGLDVSITVRWGSPIDVIDMTTQQDDLIVLTSHGRGGARRWLLGSVAEKLIRTSHSPVLLVPNRNEP